MTGYGTTPAQGVTAGRAGAAAVAATRPRAGRARWRRRMHRLSGYAFAAPYLALMAAFLLLPLGFGFGLSFVRWEMLSPLPPRWVGLGNYAEAFADAYFWSAVRATVWFVVLTVPTTVVLALLVALGLCALKHRQAWYRAAFIVPLMLNITVVAILWRWFLNPSFGLFNAYLGEVGLSAPWLTEPGWAMVSIVLMTVWWTVGGPAVILLAGLQQIPTPYYEAGAIDGVTGWKRFWYITLPLLRPTLLFVIVMNLIASFQVFGQTFLVTQGGPELSTRVLMHYIYQIAFMNYRMGYGAAMSWLLFVIIAVVSIVQFRAWRART